MAGATALDVAAKLDIELVVRQTQTNLGHVGARAETMPQIRWLCEHTEYIEEGVELWAHGKCRACVVAAGAYAVNRRQQSIHCYWLANEGDLFAMLAVPEAFYDAHRVDHGLPHAFATIRSARRSTR